MKSNTAVLIVISLAVLIAGFLALSRSQNGRSGHPSPAAPAVQAPEKGTQEKAPVSSGEHLYKTNCAVCHGDKGLGDGPASLYLTPKPRDFTKGAFKIHSTPFGDVPTDQDLLNTVTRGMPGSAMPSFAHLPEKDRRALVDHVKNFARIVTDDGTEIRPFRDWEKREIAISVEPPATAQSVALGKQLYVSKGCVKCHGESGRGDGLSAPELKDDWGYPVRPNNFTRGIYKGGGENRDVYMRFTAGMNGTPMPMSRDILTDQERWALVHFLKSFAGPKVAKQSARTKVIVTKVSDAISLNPQDPLWDRVAAVDLPLMLTWQRQESSESLSVKAVHNGTDIALLLEWADPTVNSSFFRPQDFTDGVAVQFFPGAVDAPASFTMGEKGKPVNLWFWRMDRQMDLARFADVDQIYPNMASDTTVLREAKSPFLDPNFISGRAAGNIMSQPLRLTAVENLKAEGFGTLAPLPEYRQIIDGRGVWADGSWRVVLKRKMSEAGSSELKFQPGLTVPAAFAVWDGSHQDRDGKKSVTTWQLLELEK